MKERKSLKKKINEKKKDSAYNIHSLMKSQK